MQLRKHQNKFFSYVGLGMLVAMSPLACGDDDGDSDGTGATAGSSTGGKAGSSSTGGKAGSSTGGSVNVGGDDTGVAGEGGIGVGGTGGAGPVGTARLRVVHASPTAPSVDIYPAGSEESAALGVAYGEATDFIEVDAGTISFDLRAAGADATDEAAFTTAEIELVADADYTLVAAGDFSDLEDPDVGFRVLALEHDFEAAAAGNTSVRVVHATSAWETVDFDLDSSNAVDVPGLERFGSESNVELEADAELDVNFSTEESGVLTKLTLPELTEGEELFVIATGNPGFPFRAPANGFALLVVDQDGNVAWVMEQPWIHVLNASDVGTVDIYDEALPSASARLVNDVAFESMAAFQLKPSVAGYSLKAVGFAAANGSGTAVASGATATLEAGERYLSVLRGDTLETFQEAFDLTQPTEVMFRGIHASAVVAGTIDLGAVASDALTSAFITGLSPGDSSDAEGVALNPGNLILGAAPTTTLVDLYTQRPLSGAAAPAAGERSFVVLVDDAAADPALWLVNTAVAGWELR